VVQDFDLGVQGVYLLYPAVTTVGSGGLVVGFAATSNNPPILPSLFATGQPANGTTSSVDRIDLIKAGSSSANQCYQGGNGRIICRFGDYFGASIDADPVDKNAAWLSGQYMSGPNSWATYIAKISR